jgi:hypothetical protein
MLVVLIYLQIGGVKDVHYRNKKTKKPLPADPDAGRV